MPSQAAIPFSSIANDWWEGGVRSGWRRSTARTYRAALDQHLIPYFTQQGVIEAPTIESYQAACRESGLSTATISLHRTILSSILKRATADGLISHNPLPLSRPVRKEKFHAQTWTAQEARRFLDGVAGNRYEALYAMALLLGLRSGELRSLRWRDVDVQAGSVLVSDGGQEENTRQLKSDAGFRLLPLPERVQQALPPQRHPTATVFPAPQGGILDGSSLRKDFHRLSASLDLPTLRFHELRHTCFSLMLQAGTPLHVVSSIAGHSSIRITSDVYGHISPVSRLEAVTTLESLLA